MNILKNFNPGIKLFFIVALVAIILTVGGILLLKTLQPAPSPTPIAQQTPPPTPQQEVLDTSNWQTYRNDEFGFELKYPASWQFEELDPNLSFGSFLDSAGPQKDRLYITVNGLNYTGIDNPDVVYKKEVFVGKTVTIQSVYQENKLISKGIEVPLTTGFITIYTTPDSNGSFAIIDQILSTFRFIE
jgi:hypothetical protein